MYMYIEIYLSFYTQYMQDIYLCNITSCMTERVRNILHQHRIAADITDITVEITMSHNNQSHKISRFTRELSDAVYKLFLVSIKKFLNLKSHITVEIFFWHWILTRNIFISFHEASDLENSDVLLHLSKKKLKLLKFPCWASLKNRYNDVLKRHKNANLKPEAISH